MLNIKTITKFSCRTRFILNEPKGNKEEKQKEA